MRVKTDRLQKFLLGAALIAALGWNLAHAAEVRGVQVAQGPAGTRAEIVLDSAATDYRLISLASPERLVVDLPAATLRTNVGFSAPAGVVRAVRVGKPEFGVVRIVFDLSQPVAALRPQLEPAGNGARLVIEWPGDGEPVASAVDHQPVTPRKVPASPLVGTGVPVTGGPLRIPADARASALLTGVVDMPVPATVDAGGPPVVTQPSATAPSPVRGSAQTAQTGAASTITGGGTLAPILPSAATAPYTSSTPALPRAVKSMRDPATGKPLRALVIAIDAGHGGQDPGAHGPGGRREKDITLAIARELARQVNATPGYRAYLTRDSDFFIPLNQRARLARQAKADMFVSIHADAAENPAARGSSVFVLSLKGASSQRARWLADTENAADLIGGVKVAPGNTLASVLLDLTQSGNMRASEHAAGEVLSGLAQLGPNHKDTVERANFAVLRTSDTPAMLVETAFISNPEEEQRLSNPASQQAIARAVLGGVNSYFSRQPPPGTLLAAQLEARTQAVASVATGGTGGSP